MIIETNNSERLGRVITDGRAEENTGIPVAIGGLTEERVWHSPSDGQFTTDKDIGDMVKAGDIVASVAGHPLKANIGGVVRALLRDGMVVGKGVKLGEIDPSGDREACYTIRPRVRAIAGGVLEAILTRFNV
jgi:xanthine dehydrogenase accessory factor